MRVLLLVGVLIAAAGCGGSDPPTQPKLDDSQVKDIMNRAKSQEAKERGGRGGK